MRRFFISLTLVFFYFSAWSQVTNNQIAHRFALQLDGDSIASTTSNSNVEWQCINKALTNKCLVYHNDQWFSFQVEKAGNYYLNLSSQQCKKQQGLQIILIEGNPCEVKTYSILQCISKVSQDDTFVELTNVKPNTLYLLNIDGFLGDLCDFKIQLSSHSSGLPVHFSFTDSVKVKSYLDDQKVFLTWKASPELINSIETFRVGRKGDHEAKNKWTDVGLKVNAYGQPITDYSMADTLTTQDTYTYMILGLKKENGQPIFLDKQRVSYFEKSGASLSQPIVYFSPGFAKAASLEIVILNAYTDAVIKNTILEFDPKKNKNIGIRVAEMIEEGIKNFVVQIRNSKTREMKKFYFKLDEEGRFTPYTKEQ
ncbi:MAG TPA: hypothetical protein VIT44_05090 [Cyclobacteriaceae bacterium]